MRLNTPDFILIIYILISIAQPGSPESLSFAPGSDGPVNLDNREISGINSEEESGSTVILAPDSVPVVNGKRKIIYGTFRFDSPEREWEKEISQLSKMGFNLIHSYRYEVRYGTDAGAYLKSTKAFLTLAAKYGMGVFLGLPRQLVAGKDKDISKVIHIVSELKTEPALWVWYIYDEPEKELTRDLNNVYKKIKEIDPLHPVAVTHGKMDKLNYCVSFCDILLPDHYSLPYSFKPTTILAKGIKNKLSKPFWIVCQAHAVNETHLAREWTYKANVGAQSLSFPPGTHRPNPKEIRAQFHLALSLNSPGAIYYWYPEYYYSLEKQAPEVWQALSDLGAEVSGLSHVLCSKDPVPKTQMYFNGKKKNYADLSAQKRDADSELRIDIDVPSWRKIDVFWGFNIRYWVRMHKNRLYIGLVNAAYLPHFLVTLHLPFRYARVYQEPGHRLIIDQTKTRDIISNLTQSDVVIRNNNIIPGAESRGNARTLSFFLDECSTAVWCFEPE